MRTKQDRNKRAKAHRAALRRAMAPEIFRGAYTGSGPTHLNARIRWQLERQKLPGWAIGYNMAWLKKTLTVRDHGKYFKHCINRWYQRPGKPKTRGG